MKEEVAGQYAGNLNNGVEVTRHQTFHRYMAYSARETRH
jgi:hypothetical protein